ncbi:MAG: hypothetical protein IH959_02015 [Chloroflexi bacterium]|nr:hypothetical protein [Chloroflexota bacterium]
MRAFIVALTLTFAIAVTATALVTGAQVAAQELPVGEFRVVPPLGPVGTVVAVSGDFDREITRISFMCGGFDEAHIPAEPSPSFTFEYKIPVEMLPIQGGGAMIATPIGKCEFLAEAGHKLLTAGVPFTVTEAAALPSMGLTSGSHDAAGAPTAVLILAVGGVMLLLLGWKGVST